MNVGPRQFQESSVASDESLMDAVRDQNSLDSFELLFERWQRRIHGLCFRMTGNWQDAEDLTQEVFAKLFRNRTQYKSRSSFGGFVWRVAINQTRDFARRKKREKQKHESYHRDNQTNETPVRQCQDGSLDEVQTALLKLPDICREILVLRHFENLKFKEIAELLNIPSGTVASRMARALKLMQQLLPAGNSKSKK